MTVLLVLLCVSVIALLFRSRWEAGELERLRDSVTSVELRVNGQASDLYAVSRAADSASRTAHNVLDRVREMYAHKDDVEALAAALGAERYHSPAHSGWRKKAK